MHNANNSEIKEDSEEHWDFLASQWYKLSTVKYNMICENIYLSIEQVMAEIDISRATVFRDYAKTKKITGAAMYDKKTSTWTL